MYSVGSTCRSTPLLPVLPDQWVQVGVQRLEQSALCIAVTARRAGRRCLPVPLPRTRGRAVDASAGAQLRD